MGKMKEIFMELQEKYGHNLENIDDEFSYEEYLSKKEECKSICCGGNLNKIADEKTGATFEDYGICPICLDNC